MASSAARNRYKRDRAYAARVAKHYPRALPLTNSEGRQLYLMGPGTSSTLDHRGHRVVRHWPDGDEVLK